MNIHRLWTTLSVAALTICMAASAQTAGRNATSNQTTNPALEPLAMNALKAMSKQLQAATSFSFTAHISREEPGPNGQMLNFMRTVRVQVQRPGRMRISNISSPSEVNIWCDGRTVTLMPESGAFYTTLNAGANLDETLEMLKSKAQHHTPLLPFLLADPYARLADGVQSANEVGTENDGNRQFLHLAFREADADWQLWLEGPNQIVPRRMAVIFKNVEGHPRVTVDFSDWNLNAEIPADAFTFVKPEGAKQVSFDVLRYREFPQKSAQARPAGNNR
jgi:hypothetical protein